MAGSLSLQSTAREKKKKGANMPFRQLQPGRPPLALSRTVSHAWVLATRGIIIICIASAAVGTCLILHLRGNSKNIQIQKLNIQFYADFCLFLDNSYIDKPSTIIISDCSRDPHDKQSK